MTLETLWDTIPTRPRAPPLAGLAESATLTTEEIALRLIEAEHEYGDRTTVDHVLRGAASNR